MLKKFKSLKILALLAVIIAPIVIWGVISFGASTVTLTFSILNAGGTVAGSGVSCPGDCSHVFTYGTSPTSYKATAKPGFRFRGWDTNADGIANYTTNPLNVNHTSNWNIKALFHRYSVFLVSPSDRSGGYVTGSQINCPTDCYVFYNPSTSKNRYDAHPLNGYKFQGWDVGNNGTIDSTALSYYLPLNQSLTVKAVFTKVAPSCTLSASPTTITKGAKTTISWSCPAYSKVISNWSATPLGLSGSVAKYPSATTNYAVTASNIAGSSTKSVRVTVKQPVASVPRRTTTTTSRTTTTKKTVTAQPVPVSSNVSDNQAPTSPEALSARYEADKSSVYLEWAPSKDNIVVAGYQIQKREKGQGGWTDAASAVASANFLDLSVGTEKVYEYQVRAYDGKKNYSGWSQPATVSTGPFEPNATVTEGGKIQNDESTVLVEINAGDLDEDLFFSVEPVELMRLDYGKGYQGASQVYEIKAKNRNGQEVTRFKNPITIKFLVSEDSKEAINLNTVKLARSEDSLSTTIVESKYEKESGTVTAEVDHLTPYYVVAKSKSAFWSFMKNLGIVLLVLIILGLPFAYYFYRKYKQEQNYQAIQDELKY